MSTCTIEHPVPANLTETFPPLGMPELADLKAAVSAAVAGCRPCMASHRRVAAGYPQVAHQGVTLFVMYAAVLLHAQEKDPGENAAEMLALISPDTVTELSAPTRAVLLSTPVTKTRDTPDGKLAGQWDKELLGQALAALTPADRARVWRDAMGMLTGIWDANLPGREGAAQ